MQCQLQCFHACISACRLHKLLNIAITVDLILCTVHGGLLLQYASWLNAGGVVVLAETFSHEIYRKSLARLFELDENGYLQMFFNATFDVIMSKVRRDRAWCTCGLALVVKLIM